MPMNLKKILSNEVVSINLQSTNKKDVLEELLDLMMKSGKVSDRKSALAAILEREEKMSTGIQHGVAIPHGKSDAVTELVACIGIKKEGLDFQALDGEPSKIFIMTLSPTSRTGPHVQFLAEISQLLKTEKDRDQILNAASSRELLDLFH